MSETRLTSHAYSADEPNILEKDLLDSFQINVVGVANTINAFLPLIQQGTTKKIANISTGMADMGMLQYLSAALCL